MAESPSSALPGGVEWLPALGGAHLLRAEVGRGDPPVLILESKLGAERRIEPGPEARFSRSTDFLVPAGLRWSVASLQWADGTRTVLPTPPEERAEVIPLRARRADAPPQPPAPLPWTAPPWGDTSDADDAAAGWRAQRASLEVDLSRALEAVLRIRESERMTGEAVLAVIAGARADLQAARAAQALDANLLALLEGELEAERSAGAAREESDELAAMRTQLERACHDAAIARAEVSSLRTELAAERTARGHAEAALQALARPAPRVTDLGRHAAEQAEAAATAARRPPSETGRLVAALDAAATSLRATIPAEVSPTMGIAAARETAPGVAPGVAPPPSSTTSLVTPGGSRPEGSRGTPEGTSRAPSPDESASLGGQSPAAPVAPLDSPSPAAPLDRTDGSAPAAPVAPLDSPSPAASLDRTDGSAPAASPALSLDPTGRSSVAPLDSPSRLALVEAPGLRRALVALAREDSVVAGSLLAGLLPVQGAILDGDLSYDLTVRGIGTFAVTVHDGAVRVQRIPRRRPRREAEFHVAGEPLVLAELLAGERIKVRRFRRGARVNGRRRRARVLTALPAARLSLADAVRAGARLEPALVYRALPFAVAPEWTRGHVFTVAQEIIELAPRAWYVTARDGVPLDVVEHAAGGAADATVTMTRAAFDRLLRGDPAAGGERPVIRGDHTAVATLKRWTDLARGE